MHEIAPLIKDLAVILGVASIVTLLFQKIRQPIVLGYLISGIIIGPYTPPHGLVSDIPTIKTLSELGVIFLMFSLGLEFSFRKLQRVGFSAGITGLIEVIFMLLVGAVTGKALGWSFYDCLFLGGALAISSTTIIIKALEELNLKAKHFAEIVFGILIVEDLLAILLLVMLSTMVATNDVFSSDIFVALIKLVLVVGGWFLTGYFIVPALFRKIAHYANEETLTIVSIALCLFLVCAASYVHYSTALGAFIMGSILAETPLVHRIEQLIQPVRNIFAAVFFVSVGMLIDPHIIWNQLPVVLIICAVTIVGKLLTTGIGAFLTGQSLSNSLRIGFSMAQIGEFSFIIAGLGLALNVTDNSLYPIIVAVSTVTTFTTPYFIRLSIYLSNSIHKGIPPKTQYWLESYTSWIYRMTAGSNSQPSFYRKAVMQFIINSIIIAILFTLTKSFLLPGLISFWENNLLSKITSWLAAILVSSPFVWGMVVACHNKSQINNPLICCFTALLTLIEISVLSATYFDSWSITLFCFGLVIAGFGILYKYLDKSYRWFEKQLTKNLSQKKHSRKKSYEELAPWDTYFIDVEVKRNSILIGKTWDELELRKYLGINLIAISRNDKTMLNPQEEPIQILDNLILLGDDEKIELFNQKYIKAVSEEKEEKDLLETFALKTVWLEEKNPLIGTTIKRFHSTKKNLRMIVGMERDGIRHLNPSPGTKLRLGDVLFVVEES
jgi:CPA2 family monovalent cation:H+ antiporter-2